MNLGIMAQLKAKAWMLGAGAATVTALSLAIALGVCTVQKNRVVTARDALAASIDAPVTGWAARLRQSEANVGVLDKAIAGQNDAIKANAKASAERLAEAEKGLETARRDQAKAAAKIEALMKPLVGADTCTRVIEADERLMRSLGP